MTESPQSQSSVVMRKRSQGNLLPLDAPLYKAGFLSMIKALPGLKGGPGKNNLFFFAVTFSIVGSRQIHSEENKNT